MISVIPNQEPLRYGTTIKLPLSSLCGSSPPIYVDHYLSNTGIAIGERNQIRKREALITCWGFMRNNE